MRYSIDKNSKKSAYLQLYVQLRTDIINSIYKYGEKLPSKRILAEETQTSVITVEHAYEILCDEGYVTAKPRSGYFVSYKKDSFIPATENDEIPFSEITSYNHTDDDFPFSVFAKTMRRVLSKYNELILIKSPNEGVMELRKALSGYLARNKGITAKPHQIIIGSGSEYLYGLIVQFFGNSKVYAVENPSYEKIHLVYQANGARCEFLKLGKDGILSSELIKSSADILHVTPVRSYPSGITASASKRNEYIQWATGRGNIIIEDDFDSEFTLLPKNEETLFSMESKNSVIYINTFTKTIAPSMRVGYIVLPENLVESFYEKMGFYSCTVPVFEQYVLAEFINNGDFERHINRVRRKRRQHTATM